MALILIALIHNNNQERMASCREVVRYLQSELSASQHKVQVKEFWEQEPIQTASRLSWLKARLRAARSQYVYTRFHLQQAPRFWLPYLLGSLDVIQVLSCTKKKLRFWEVEKIVTRKHISAWNAGSEFDFTIVVEDDAVVGKDLNLLAPILLMEVTRSIESGSATYLDIAGGYPLDLIATKHSIVQDGFVSATIVFTNTACVYGFNRFLAKAMSDAVTRAPKMRELGVDFLMNALFLEISNSSSRCVHFTMDAIRHGSMDGKYKSWTQE
jgi:hypothetical protein